jgi:ribonuclease R
MSKWCSDREILAAKAQRDSIKYKQVEYLEDKIGTIHNGIVSGVTDWGMYVELVESKCEGMVKFRDLGDEFFTFDDKNYVVKGDRGTIYRMGDVYKVKVAKADLEQKIIDYKIVSKVREMGKRKITK